MTAADVDDLALTRGETIATERAASLAALCAKAGVNTIYHFPCLPDGLDTTPRTDAFLARQRITTCQKDLCMTAHSCSIDFQKITPLPLLGPVMVDAVIK